MRWWFPLFFAPFLTATITRKLYPKSPEPGFSQVGVKESSFSSVWRFIRGNDGVNPNNPFALWWTQAASNSQVLINGTLPTDQDFLSQSTGSQAVRAESRGHVQHAAAAPQYMQQHPSTCSPLSKCSSCTHKVLQLANSSLLHLPSTNVLPKSGVFSCFPCV